MSNSSNNSYRLRVCAIDKVNRTVKDKYFLNVLQFSQIVILFIFLHIVPPFTLKSVLNFDLVKIRTYIKLRMEMYGLRICE